ncbi:septal ring lytic transglycosylase RlpA family protein [Pararhizobium sp.]|uniref:septal ring lytic transglycosylase RlpA family protein n=1 Tax=Pararhizobium sp. TaxID=1977563 RepID=UPI003D0C1DC0
MKFMSVALAAVFTLGATVTAVTPSQAAPGQSKVTPATAGNCGGASWYALTSRTASGERMNASYLTAAHRNLRFGTKVAVTNKRNGKTVVVRINDRGPFIRGRVLDLSKAAASHIGMVSSGTASICYRVVS